MSASSGTVSDIHSSNVVQLCWSMEIKKVRLVQQENNLFLHALAGPVWMSSQDFRHASPSVSAKDAEMQLLAFPSFPSPFPSFPISFIQDCPLHVNSLPSICTSGFPVLWEHQRPQLSNSSGCGVIEICTWSFQKWMKGICFFSSSKYLWRYLHSTFFFFCTNSKVILYLWAGAWKLRRSPGWSTGTPHRACSWSISGGWRTFIVSLPLSVERKWSIWSLELKIKVS